MGNQTIGQNVFFDNLVVQHYTGPLVEENQYYPFGLVQKGISSKAFGRLENKIKFNGYEENKTFDLNWLESFYRTYDPQLGRFWQVDPKPIESINLYAAMNNSPVLIFDVLGDTGRIGTNTDDIVRVKGKEYKKDALINQLVNEWSVISGLNLSVGANGELVNGGVATNRKISRTARKEILDMINSPGNIHIDFCGVASQRISEDDLTMSFVAINPTEMEAQVNRISNDLNKMTFGTGMTALHELGHTLLHSNFKHDESTTLSKFGIIDESDVRVNVMRRELGSSWGQRLSYLTLPFNGAAYLPMTNASLRAMQATLPKPEHAMRQNPFVQAAEMAKLRMPTSWVIIIQ